MEGAVHSHRDFPVRKSVVHRALNWLVTHNQYYRSNHVHIDVNLSRRTGSSTRSTRRSTVTSAVVSPTEPEVHYTCTFLFAAEYLLSASAVTGLFS